MPTTTHPPIRGSVRLLCRDHAVARDGLLAGGALTLLIAAHTKRGEVRQAYTLRQLTDGGRVVGYELANAQNGKVYHIDISFRGGSACWVCDCPDKTYRDRQCGCCKHSAALAKVLDLLGIKE